MKDESSSCSESELIGRLDDFLDFGTSQISKEKKLKQINDFVTKYNTVGKNDTINMKSIVDDLNVLSESNEMTSPNESYSDMNLLKQIIQVQFGLIGLVNLKNMNMVNHFLIYKEKQLLLD